MRELKVMKTGRFLAIILFAVTALSAGGWAQGAPPAPSGDTPSSEQAPPSSEEATPVNDGHDEQGQALEQNYPQTSNDAAPNAETAPSLQERAPRSEGPAPSVARVSLIHGDVSTQRGDSG